MNNSIMEGSVMNSSSTSNGGHPSTGNPGHLSYRHNRVTGVIDNREERPCPIDIYESLGISKGDNSDDKELEEEVSTIHETVFEFFHIDGPGEYTKIIGEEIEGDTYYKVEEKTLEESKSLDVEGSSTKMLVDELSGLEHMDIAPIDYDMHNWKPCFCLSNSCTRTIVSRVFCNGNCYLVFLPSTVTISQVMETVAYKLHLTLNTFQLKVIDLPTRPCCRSLVTFVVV